MSNSLAISAVTRTLRNLLATGLASSIPGATVTTKPLDKARSSNADASQINLFLYQTETNPAFSNADPPGRARSGEAARPPLALGLHYLLTAFGKGDDEAEGHEVLGLAMKLLHDHPVLLAPEIEAALPECDLDQQPARVRVTPQPLSLDDMSKLWNAFQTQYRVSAAYHVSVVLIDSDVATRAPLPVLMRGTDDVGVAVQPSLTPPFPTLTGIEIPEGRPTAHLGDKLDVTGHHLAGDTAVPLLRNRRRAEPIELPALAPTPAGRVEVQLPADPEALFPGVWGLSLRILAGGRDRTTNELPFALAPRVLAVAPNPAPAGDVTFTAAVSPRVLPEQPAALLLGDREIPADTRTQPETSLTFRAGGVEAGRYFVRLRIDGIDSNLIDRTTTPPRFDPSQRVTVT